MTLFHQFLFFAPDRFGFRHQSGMKIANRFRQHRIDDVTGLFHFSFVRQSFNFNSSEGDAESHYLWLNFKAFKSDGHTKRRRKTGKKNNNNPMCQD